MKFVNYGIPTGLGIKEFNTSSSLNSNKHPNLNGITNENIKNTQITKNALETLQLGGGHHNMVYLPCETVFYAFEHPITFPEVESNLKNAIEFMVENNKNVDSKSSIKNNKIVSLRGLFSQNKNDEVSRDTSYETSNSSLKSILRALKDSKNTA